MNHCPICKVECFDDEAIFCFSCGYNFLQDKIYCSIEIDITRENLSNHLSLISSDFQAYNNENLSNLEEYLNKTGFTRELKSKIPKIKHYALKDRFIACLRNEFNTLTNKYQKESE